MQKSRLVREMERERREFNAQFQSARECGWIRVMDRADDVAAVQYLALCRGWDVSSLKSASYSESQYISLRKGEAHITVRFSSHPNGAYDAPQIVEQDGLYRMWFMYEHQIVDLEAWMAKQD